ncbi:FHA domain-containing protein [Hyphomonas chukchiensis]|uniref:FHA domain-containing protein n=1 Tax=Hyphomonas chukchiensis TaxID=1280947 RepID=UPI0030F5F9F2
MARPQPSTAYPAKCCFRASLDRDATFCDECGSPLQRCMATDECGGLLDAAGCCPVCVAPELSLDAGSATSVRVGGTLALPLIVSNNSPVGRPLFVEEMRIQGDDGEQRPVDLTFQRLNSGSTAEVGLRTGVLETAGLHRFDVHITVATRYLWREERYVFTTSIAIPVDREGPSEIVQNYNIQADAIGAGMTIYNPTRIQKEREAGIATYAEPIRITLRRADTLERTLGHRGYAGNLAVTKSTELVWQGFDKGHAPYDGPIRTHTGVLGIGRASNAPEGGMNDVRLLISRKGEIDEDASIHISRRHFQLFIENDRLMLRVESQNGLLVGDQALRRGKMVALRDGDLIRPLVRSPDAIALKVQFETRHDEVDRIILKRLVGGQS